MERKFNKFLSAVLIIIAVSIFVILGFVLYNFFQKKAIDSKTDKALDEFDKKIEEIGGDIGSNNGSDDSSDNSNSDSGDEYSDDYDAEGYGVYGGPARSLDRISYDLDGYDIVGKIEIPKTKTKYPIFDVATISSMKVSVGIVYGPGLNEVGNTVIMGHNYRNGTFFSNNDRLDVGNLIYITDAYGWRLRYRIYNKYETNSSDFDYATRNTYGEREISLASCTDDSKSRLIIWARAD